MKNRLGFVKSKISHIHKAGLYRRIAPSKIDGSEITIGRKVMINMCSNDYLGMPQSIGAIRTGQMQSSSRLLSGNDLAIHELESTLADTKPFDASLVFPTGYMANIGVITALAEKGDCILSDELNHASIIDACRLSGAKTIVYGHNDMDDLEKKCKKSKGRTFIITEGTFSMDGDTSDAKNISKISTKYDAVTILDDAHGDFALGSNGFGSWALSGHKPDVYVSSLSKALGSFGGYIASSLDVIDLCINTSRTLIYTSAIPSHMAMHAKMRILHDSRLSRQNKLAKNSAYMQKLLYKSGYDVSNSSHIIPIHIGSEKTAMEFSKKLSENGVYAQAVRYPTVKKNSARIRLSVTAKMHTLQIRQVSDIIKSLGVNFNII